MRVYITGIEGMLGSALAYVHSKLGHEVYGCDVWATTVKGRRADIRSVEIMRDEMKAIRPHRVYHCAAMLGVENTEKHPEVCKNINEYGTSVVAEAAARAQVAEFVFLSSSEVYGNGYDFKPFSEHSPLVGDNVYAVSKKRGEHVVLSYKDDMKVVITRMFNCFGLYQVKQFFIPKAIDLCSKGRAVPIYGSFGNRRSYLFGHDAATFIKEVADKAPSGEIVNVAHHESYTLQEVYEIIATEVGGGGGMSLRTGSYDDRSVSRDVPNRLAVIDKLKSYSRHRPTDLPEAIRLVAHLRHTLRDDWDYAREVF